jgi:hypothetical protein
VTDQYCRTLLHRERALRRLDGFRQRRQRVLHRSYIQTLRLQPGDHFGPARTVSEKSVDKDDVASLWRGLGSSGVLEKRTGHPSSHHAHERSTVHQKPHVEVHLDRSNIPGFRRARVLLA